MESLTSIFKVVPAAIAATLVFGLIATLIILFGWVAMVLGIFSCGWFCFQHVKNEYQTLVGGRDVVA